MKINKKLLKIVIIMLLLFMVGIMISNKVSAWEMVPMLNKIESKAEVEGNTSNRVTNIMGGIINITSTVGAGIAIIMLVVIGISYITKSAEGKAEAKKDLTGYVIGAIILFGVSGILKILQMFIDANVNNV